MSTPIVEQVAAALATQVATVTTGNGYNYTIHTVRRFARKHIKELDEKPHLMCKIEQEDGEVIQESQGNPVILELAYTFHVYVFISPSENDQTAIDTYKNVLWADVTKAVAAKWDDGSSLDTLVREWHVLPPISFTSEDGSYDGIDCRFQAIIRTNETDPFTQR